jgi:hypothetical protein
MKTSYLNRRDFLKISGVTTSLTALPSMTFGRNDEVIVGHGSHQYKVVKGWGVLDADKNPVNDCHEMVEVADGRLFMLTNETKNNVLIYDKSGKLLDVWGASYPGAHGLTVAGEGKDQFLLICDNNRSQVIKTDLKGKELMKLEYPKETGKYDYPGQFVPTETCVNPVNGDIYVADGYGKSLIIQYTSKGEYIRHFGGRGKENENLNCSHGILIDSRGGKTPTLLVTSRDECSWKRFTLDGKYLSTIHLPGTFICRPVIRDNYLIGASFRSTSQSYPNSGYVQILNADNKVISTPGGSEPIYQNGELQKQRQEDPTNIFMHPHDVYMDADDSLYVPQWASQKTYPIKLERT